MNFEPGAFVVSNVKTTSDAYSTRTTGILASTFKDDQTSVRVSAIYRSAGGRIIGGDFTFVDKLPAGKKASFEVSTLGKMKGVAKTEAYANP